MAKRKTQIDRAIERLESEKAVIDAAIVKLREQQSKPRLVMANTESA